MAESVTVARDGQAVAADRAQPGVRLERHAGADSGAVGRSGRDGPRSCATSPAPDAIIRVDSFEGQQLPPKSQIKSIHVTRDQFAAETEQPGSTFVDVITQPGHRSGSRRRELLVPRRLDEREEPVHADQGTGADPRLRLQHRRRAGQAEEQLLDRGQRTEQLHHAESERGHADRHSASTCSNLRQPSDEP